jgi:hypothetical protein
MAKYKYFGMAVTNKNCMHEKIKSRLNSWSACYHLLQNILSSHVLSKNIKIKIHRIIILPVLLHGCEIWPFTLG